MKCVMTSWYRVTRDDTKLHDIKSRDYGVVGLLVITDACVGGI